MRVFVAMLALFPMVAAAAQNLGPYQITSGTVISENGEVSGNGFTASLFAAPPLLSAPIESTFRGGTPPLSFCFGCGLPGPDDGVGVLSVTTLNDPALAGMVQLFGPQGYLESGELAVSPTIDVTGAGTYSAPFTMSAALAYGLPHATVPKEYVHFVGSGTVTLDLGPAQCRNGPGGPCGPLQISSLQYNFAPELDPASLSGALTLLGGSLLVFRGRRSRAR
jgi:hypothetical protein